MHRRLAPDGLEIGYWIHPLFTRRGLATTVTWLLTDTALALPDITYVEIHHDKANIASAGVPRRLGFELVAETPDAIEAPGEIGIECRWRMDRERWRGVERHDGSARHAEPVSGASSRRDTACNSRTSA